MQVKEKYFAFHSMCELRYFSRKPFGTCMITGMRNVATSSFLLFPTEKREQDFFLLCRQHQVNDRQNPVNQSHKGT